MLANALLPRHLEGERVQADAPTVAGYCPDAVFEPPNCACVELEKDAGMWVTDNALGVAHAILPEHSAFVFSFPSAAVLFPKTTGMRCLPKIYTSLLRKAYQYTF